MSAKYGLPYGLRLHTADEFGAVFQHRCSVGGNFFQTLAKPNHLGHPRLGVVVSRKTAGSAVARNYIKRAIREFFRQQQEVFDSLDVVIRVRRGFTHTSLPQAQKELLLHLTGIGKCRA